MINATTVTLYMTITRLVSTSGNLRIDRHIFFTSGFSWLISLSVATVIMSRGTVTPEKL